MRSSRSYVPVLLGDDGAQQRKRSLEDNVSNGDEDEEDALSLISGGGDGGETPFLALKEGAGKNRPSRKPRRLSKVCLAIAATIVAILSLLIAFAGYAYFGVVPQDGLSPPWYPSPRGGALSSWSESYKKAQKMVDKMTLVEKVNVTTGCGWMMNLCVGNTGPALDVGFPSLCLQDGPLGIRFTDHVTTFPAALTVGATWNKTLMRMKAVAHGEEARGKGINVLLGPAMGPIGRQPAGGRGWESFGSDPVLQGIAAYETIVGIQSQGVIATAKHYVGNEQEHFRRPIEWGLPHSLSANIDDRTMHEIYAWPFAESVRAGVGSVMCSYQMVNNSYACGNSALLNGLLKDELGFQGFVQSDWLAQHGGVSTALAGLDMSMDGDGDYHTDGKSFWGEKLTIAILNGSVPMERLNDMTTRIVAAWYQLGQDKWNITTPNFSSFTRDKLGSIHPGASEITENVTVNHFVDVRKDHHTLAREIAAQGAVLVKNEDSILPLSPTAWHKVAIIGEDAGPGAGPNACGVMPCNQGTLASGWGSGSTEFPYLIDPASALSEAFQGKAAISTYLRNDDSKELRNIGGDADICFVFSNSDSGEGYQRWENVRGDRNDINLQKNGDNLIKAAAEVCQNTVVIIHAVGAVIVEQWADLPNLRAIVLAQLPGQESGNSLVDVLFGHVDASGRLPYTVGKSLDDYGPGAKVMYYPNAIIPQANFDERLYFDYRHFDKYEIEPRYPFGFGMSYTSFKLSRLSVTELRAKSSLPDLRPEGIAPPKYDNSIPGPETALYPDGFRKLVRYIYPYIHSTEQIREGSYPYPKGYDEVHEPSAAGGGEGGNPSLYDTHATVNVTITNTGSRRGQTVAQLYVSFPDDVQDIDGTMIDFPPKVLRAFEKVDLEVNESQAVSMELSRKDLSYWSSVRQNWIMPDGKFKILVGQHSRDAFEEGIY